MSKSKVLFFMSGSIAAFKACQVISRLVQDGCEVQVIATPSTFQFIGASTLEGLTGRKVLSDLWEPGHAMDHIHLSRDADYGVICPASANTIARLAAGFSDDLLSAILLAWPKEKPLTIVPAMNHEMLSALPTRENLSKLAARGWRISATQNGALACGEDGAGRMLEVEDILNLLHTPRWGRILITGGATREPIDGIRFLSNVSTGQTAARLTLEFSQLGWAVTYLHGVGAVDAPQAERQTEFTSCADLQNQLRRELGSHEYAAVIHAAAVSDYHVENAAVLHKLSTQEELTLKLKANPKLLGHLKEYSRHKDIKIIGFKLTLGADSSVTQDQAKTLLGDQVDAVIANDWNSVQADRSKHPGTLIAASKSIAFADLAELANLLHAMTKTGGSHDSRP